MGHLKQLNLQYFRIFSKKKTSHSSELFLEKKNIKCKQDKRNRVCHTHIFVWLCPLRRHLCPLIYTYKDCLLKRAEEGKPK